MCGNVPSDGIRSVSFSFANVAADHLFCLIPSLPSFLLLLSLSFVFFIYKPAGDQKRSKALSDRKKESDDESIQRFPVRSSYQENDREDLHVGASTLAIDLFNTMATSTISSWTVSSLSYRNRVTCWAIAYTLFIVATLGSSNQTEKPRDSIRLSPVIRSVIDEKALILHLYELWFRSGRYTVRLNSDFSFFEEEKRHRVNSLFISTIRRRRVEVGLFWPLATLAPKCYLYSSSMCIYIRW